MDKTLALDASQRTKDENGHLRVGRTCISKADVNPYFGREIPDYENLGLDGDKVYNLLRCPEELAKGADTFKGKQLLLKHIPVDAIDPQKEYTIGSIGSEIVFDDGSLFADMTVWDAAGIELIESGKMRELSSGYAYTPDMTPGVYKNVAYDGIMRNIRGNHVALVERGRIGRDAIIADSLPFELGLKMKLKQGALKRISEKIGMDEDVTKSIIEEVAENIEHKPAYDEDKLRELAGDNYEEIVKLIGGDVGDEDSDKKAEDEQTRAERDNESEADRLRREEDRLKEREDRERKDRDKDRAEAKAMDADTIARAVEQRIEAKYTARDAVEPLVGKLALDGFADAAAVYAYALKQKGIACDGINEAGLKALVAMQRDIKPAATIAQDSAVAPSKLTQRFKQG